MLTDDPGTPGPRTWEINVGWLAQRVPGSFIHYLPLLDANYGLGNRIELTYEAPWGIVTGGGHRQADFGNSEVSLKWRFVDTDGWQASVYPAFDFQTPGSRKQISGLTDSARTFELPLQLERSFGAVSINVDAGRNFSTDPDDDGWFGGVAAGRDLRPGWELVVELHALASPRFDRREWIAHAGTRIDLSNRLTLMFAYGRDVSNDLLPRTFLTTYAGLQLRIGQGPKAVGSRSGRHK